ncbi:hypothetical protein BCR34DRAFT_498641 [Clohesyomyces aquaticus]|uniref:Fe2OG dioxygenase domain-containing protein n=1 Tax=Clohesyomyces aquaticus TaxID=1231657 RepID=A0A1Y1YBR3_9PLEO|nr:hypothetical protein BCR34DRAFT_498641 [Clohesyomyces aquaticus]
MASTTSRTPSESHFSISSLISRFRTRRRRTSPSLPPDTRPSLIPSSLPLVLPPHQSTLSNLGWTTVTFPHSQSDVETDAPGVHPLQRAYEGLFAASKAFFNLPDSEKEIWKTQLGSEEGWSKILGEKEFITLRTVEGTPDVLKEAAKNYWDVAGTYLDACLGRIGGSLGMREEGDGGLTRFVGACKTIGEQRDKRTATMLRLFRYEGWDEKVVAEPHADLGLLSMVIGNVPGLEVWNGQQFVPIEKTYNTPCATLLGGRQLQRLTNFRYPAGGHRVVSYGKPSPPSPSGTSTGGEDDLKYRFSIVFVLRADEPVMVDTDALTTEITGKWETPIRGITAGKMYEEIRNAHFNINIGLKERDEQRKKVLESKKKGDVKASG